MRCTSGTRLSSRFLCCRRIRVVGVDYIKDRSAIVRGLPASAAPAPGRILGLKFCTNRSRASRCSSWSGDENALARTNVNFQCAILGTIMARELLAICTCPVFLMKGGFSADLPAMHRKIQTGSDIWSTFVVPIFIFSHLLLSNDGC